MVEEYVLAPAQRRVLQAIYDQLVELGRWPNFAPLDREFRREKVDFANVYRGLPSELIRPGGDLKRPSPEDLVRLTLVGLSYCAGTEGDLDLAFRIIRFAARQEIAGTEINPVTITSIDVAKALRISHARNLDRLLRVDVILVDERWGQTSSGWTPDGWKFGLGREVWRFAKVKTVDQYRDVHRRWTEELSGPWLSNITIKNTAPVHLGQKGVVAVVPYADPIIVDKLAAAAGSKWDCSKLRQLVLELNDNYARGNGLAAHALLRAILDHVPPLFGYQLFSEVINNYSWSATDKRYMKKLGDFRNQADDALHRQIKITKYAPIPRIDDLPNRLAVDHLLTGCLNAL